MTSIYDIAYQDIKKFLQQNKQSFMNKDDAYELASILLKDKKSKGHSIVIIVKG